MGILVLIFTLISSSYIRNRPVVFHIRINSHQTHLSYATFLLSSASLCVDGDQVIRKRKKEEE